MRGTIIAIGLLGCVAGGGLVLADDAKPVSVPNDYDFSSKVLLVCVRPRDSKSASNCFVLTVPQIRTIGGQFFLGGVYEVGSGQKPAWAKNAKFWTPMSEVVNIGEFETLDDVKKAFAEHDKAAQKTGEPAETP